MNLSLILFLIGIFGFVLNRKNVILMLISIEIMLSGITYLILVTSLNIDEILGQVYAIYIIAIAGAESAIGLGILVAFYRLRGSETMKFKLAIAKLYTDILQHLRNIAYRTQKCYFYSPTKAHAFESLPLQIRLTSKKLLFFCLEFIIVIVFTSIITTTILSIVFYFEGSIISVVTIWLCFNVVYIQWFYGKSVYNYLWAKYRFSRDLLHHLVYKAYSFIECGLNRAPRPHFFAMVSMESVPFYQSIHGVNNLITQFDTLDLTVVTLLLGIITNKIVAIFSEQTFSTSPVIFEQVIPLITPILNGILTYEEMLSIIATYMLQDGAGVVIDSTQPHNAQFLARLIFGNLLLNTPQGIPLAGLQLADPSTGEYIIESKWLVMALGDIGSDEANRILNILTTFRTKLR